MDGFKSSINKNLNETENRFSQFSTKISSLVKVALTGAIAKVSFDQLFKNPLKVSADFEAQMSNVKSLIFATSKDINADLDLLTKKAEELGATTKFTAKEVAEGYEFMAAKGWNAKQMEGGIQGLVHLSSAANIELADATAILTGSLASFKMGAGEATRAADAFAYTAARSGANIPAIGESMEYVGLSAKNMGVDIETTVAMLGKLGDVEILGSSAGTALNAMFTDMKKKAKNGALKVGETFVNIADNAGNYRNIIDIISDIDKATSDMGDVQRDTALLSFLDTRGLKAMNALLGAGSEKLREFTQAIYNSKDAAKDMAAIKLDNLQGDITLLQSAFQGLQKKVGDKILPHVRDGVQSLTKALDGLSANGSIDRIAEAIGNITSTVFEELINVIQNLPDTISKVASAFEWLGKNFRHIIELVKMGIELWLMYKATMLVVTVATNPLMAVIGALILLIIKLYTESETFRRIINLAFNAIKMDFLVLARVWLTCVNFILAGIEKIVGGIPVIGDAVRGVSNTMRSLLGEIDSGINNTYNNMVSLMGLANATSQAANSATDTVGQSIGNSVSDGIKALKANKKDNETSFSLPYSPSPINVGGIGGGSGGKKSGGGGSSSKTWAEAQMETIDKKHKNSIAVVESRIELARETNDTDTLNIESKNLESILKNKLNDIEYAMNKASKDEDRKALEAERNNLLKEIVENTKAETKIEIIDKKYEKPVEVIESRVNLASELGDIDVLNIESESLKNIINEKITEVENVIKQIVEKSDEEVKTSIDKLQKDNDLKTLEVERNNLLKEIAEIAKRPKENMDTAINVKDDNFQDTIDVINSRWDLAEKSKDKTAFKGIGQSLLDILWAKFEEYSSLIQSAIEPAQKNVLETARNKLLLEISNTSDKIRNGVENLVGEFNKPAELGEITKYAYDVLNSNDVTNNRLAVNNKFSINMHFKNLDDDVNKKLKAQTENIMQDFSNDLTNYFMTDVQRGSVL